MQRKMEVNVHCEPIEGQPLLGHQGQVTRGQPQAAPQVTWTTITPIPGDRLTLFPRPIPSRSPTRSCRCRGRQEGRHSVPQGSVTLPQRLSVLALPPLHGPQITQEPPTQLSCQRSRVSSASIKLPPLPAAASGLCLQGTARPVGAASDRVKLPPLPEAAAASGSSPRGTTCAVGSMARGQPELVPPSPWGTLAAGRAQGSPSLESRKEGLWHGSAARPGHCLPPLHPAVGAPLHTGHQLAWKDLGHSDTEEFVKVQGRQGGNTDRHLSGGLCPHLLKDRSTMSTGACELSSVHQEVDEETKEQLSVSSSSKGSTAEAEKCSESLSPAQLAEQSSVSENSQPWDSSLKELEKKQEAEDLPEAQAAGQWDSELQSTWHAPLKEKEAEAEASALAGDSWDERHSKIFLTSEPEETSGFSAFPLSGGPCEERAIPRPAEHAALHKQLCLGPDALLHLMREKREEMEKLEEEKMYVEMFGDISSSTESEESPMTSSCILRDPSNPTLEPVPDSSVPHCAFRVPKDATAETQNYSTLVSPELLADSESDSDDSLSLETLLNELLEKWKQEEAAGERDREVESLLSLLPRDEEFERAPTPPDSDVSDEGHSEALPTALPEESEMLAACALPVDAEEVVDAAWMEAGCAQATPPQEKPCGAEPPTGACPEPAQPLARCVPARPAASAAVPQPPAPRRWRSVVKTARRALRRLLSFSCLRGQREE